MHWIWFTGSVRHCGLVGYGGLGGHGLLGGLDRYV